MKKLLMLFLILLIVFFAGIGCHKSNQPAAKSENEQMGITFKGQESQLNGTWLGTADNGIAIQFNFQSGKVIEEWYDWVTGGMYGSGGWMNDMKGNEGYIGYYSFDGTNFALAVNDSAPGAPVTTVTRTMTGTISGSTISGTTVWNQTNTYNFSITKQ